MLCPSYRDSTVYPFILKEITQQEFRLKYIHLENSQSSHNAHRHEGA